MNAFCWFVIGTALKLLGIVLRKEQVLNLGHYLQGTGKPRKLHKHLHSEINALWVEKARHLGVWPDGETGLGKAILVPDEETSLYSTIGKFRAYYVCRTNNIEVEDYYFFYAICNKASAHFYGCGCPKNEKHWATLDRAITIGKHKQLIWDHAWWIKKDSQGFPSNLHIAFYKWAIHASVQISDSFWVDKGKPFYSRATLQLNKS